MSVLNMHKRAGCETMPTDDFDFQPANDDGLIHWCEVSREAVLLQEVRDPKWLQHQAGHSTLRDRATAHAHRRDVIGRYLRREPRDEVQ